MKVDVIRWDEGSGWSIASETIADKSKAQLVIFFASPKFYKNKVGTEYLRTRYPNAQLVGCSTGGEILKGDALDNAVVASAVEFANTPIASASVSLKDGMSSHDAGAALAKALLKDDLRHIYILSDGIKVNGSELVKGLLGNLPPKITLTGGLAGDGADFGKTFVTLGDVTDSQMVAAIGFYGKGVKIGYGSIGGWDAFGPERIITRSQGNILYELDNQPALELYKSYLGDEARSLPGSGLLYPLAIRANKESAHELVRTIVGVDEANQSLTFAGDVTQGYVSRLMKGNFNNLVDGAMQAADLARKNANEGDALVLSVSCIGRKLLLGQRISDETEIINEVMSGKVPLIGFYSYGEICHHAFTNQCDLHNQTMTITYISESV